ncbi:hypothetical protein ACQEVF_23395 [Nonomuraea polychroma]|uniref:hypothetical protein n=1 Tax=Nonomuraea polychroma TaxID=46176 RepID=UPI003D8DF9EE
MAYDLSDLKTRTDLAASLAQALAARYADPARARANWGDHDPETMLVKRLARDALWDDEVRRQADRHGLDTIVIDGSIPVADLASRLAARFWLES